jgi:HipA-like protein
MKERKAMVLLNGELAGTLFKNEGGYTFRYDDLYYNDSKKPAISATFPKSQQEFHSNFLFSFFFNMLSEGVNRQLQCKRLKIDENDFFSLLLATAGNETIGAVSIKPI